MATKSVTILGRVQNRRAFHRAGRQGTWFVVSVFPTRQGKRFFTDPVAGVQAPRPSVMYRVRVYPKRDFSAFGSGSDRRPGLSGTSEQPTA